MPCNFAANATQYGSFCSYVRTHYPYKALVPFLGYYADLSTNPLTYFNPPVQTGNAGGGTGHIEVAKQYATNNLIFYYFYPGSFNHFWDLVTYLNNYYSSY